MAINHVQKPSILPAALRRVDAAIYCGVSPTHFDKMVKDRALPPAREGHGVKLWLRAELEEYLYELPSNGSAEGNTCDQAFGL